MTLAAMAAITVFLFGSGWFTRGAYDAVKRAGQRADELADPDSCDWCYGFTSDPRKCRCTEKCTFVPLCGWEADRG